MPNCRSGCRGHHKAGRSALPQRYTAGTPARSRSSETTSVPALANAIETGDAALAVQLVDVHPQRDRANASRVGEVFLIPASRVLDLPGAAEQPGYPRVLVVAAYDAHDSGHRTRRRHSAVKPWRPRAACALRSTARRSKSMRLSLQAESHSRQAPMPKPSRYNRAAELASADGYPGLAAIFLAYGVSSALLGGMRRRGSEPRRPRVDALARQSDMPGQSSSASIRWHSRWLTLTRNRPGLSSGERRTR